jgi:uncharacterized protein (DUF1778 family)
MIPARKDNRLNLRVTKQQRALIRRAAAQAGVSDTDFILESATERAAEVLTDQRLFVVNDAQWRRFVAALEAPAKPVPALVELFKNPKL